MSKGIFLKLLIASVIAGLIILGLLLFKGESYSPKNILFFIFDAARAKNFSSYGYQRPATPFIDKLAEKEGMLFENAYSQTSWTLPSVYCFL